MVLIEQRRARPVDVRSNSVRIRLAETPAEVLAGQELRYRIFCEEMGAKPTPEMAAARREFDRFDDVADHLLVFDVARANGGAAAVIGTYRLIRREAALRAGQFYSKDEYDISAIEAYDGEVLELGRSCIHADYRTGSIMTLLWRGIAEYVLHFDVAVMFGCASLPGTDPQRLALPLSYLYHHHLAPPALRPRAVAERYTEMNLMAAEEIDVRLARLALPPLIKGYLRLGGFVGDGAVVDPQFNTTDVCIVVKTDLVTEKYFRHYTREDSQPREEGGL